jgi:hypothetical protein
MATHTTGRGHQKFERVGRILAHRLHEARKRSGVLCCPVCQHIFEGTHVIKCPECRTLINNAFQEVHSSTSPRNLELDFFLQS